MTFLVRFLPAVWAFGLRQMFKMMVMVMTMLCWGLDQAQLPLQPVGSPFDMTGFIQNVTLNPRGDVLTGGTLTVNGTTITVPRKTIMQMPAFALTWAQLFTMAPAPLATCEV